MFYATIFFSREWMKLFPIRMTDLYNLHNIYMMLFETVSVKAPWLQGDSCHKLKLLWDICFCGPFKYAQWTNEYKSLSYLFLCLICVCIEAICIIEYHVVVERIATAERKSNLLNERLPRMHLDCFTMTQHWQMVFVLCKSGDYSPLTTKYVP